jgi:DNA polymerase III alpha subunit
MYYACMVLQFLHASEYFVFSRNSQTTLITLNVCSLLDLTLQLALARPGPVMATLAPACKLYKRQPRPVLPNHPSIHTHLFTYIDPQQLHS